MIKSVHKSGLQTLALPSYKNEEQEYVSLVVYVGTIIDLNKMENQKELDVRLNYSPSHLIEHTVAVQNDILYNNLRKEKKMKLINACTDVTKTYYIFQVKANALKTTLPIILDSIYKLKLDKNIYKPEQEVIDHEFYSKKIDNLTFKDLILDSKMYEKILSMPANTKLIKEKEKYDALANEIMHQNLSTDYLQNYYEEHYVPQNSIITITNCDQKIYKDFQEEINKYFESSQKNVPVVNDLKKFRELYNGTHTDTVVNSLFDSKYKIYELKDRLSDRSKYEFFFKFPKMDTRYSTVSELYQYIITKPDVVDFNDNDLRYFLRRKRHLVYSPKTYISNFKSKDKSVLTLVVDSNCINTHKIMTGVRGLINKIAFNNIVPLEKFKNLKERFKEYYLINSFYNQSATAIMEYNVTSLMSGNKHFDIVKETKLIDNIRYDDFINFSKYVAKTDDYSISAYGNNIELSALKAFELKNKQIFTGKDSLKYIGDQGKLSSQRNQVLIMKDLPPLQSPEKQSKDNNSSKEK